MDNILLQKINDAIRDVSNAYNKVDEKGGTIPEIKKISNLANSISTIPTAGETLCLNDQIVLAPSNEGASYNVKVPKGKDGYTDISINASLILKEYNFNNGSIDIDLLEKFDGVDEYQFNTGNDDVYTNKLTADFNTIYRKDLITSYKQDDINVKRVAAYTMFAGFYNNGTEIVDIDYDTDEFRKFICAVLLTNISPDLQTCLNKHELLMLTYDFIDYTIDENGVIIEQKLQDFNHEYIEINNYFLNYNNLNEIVQDLPNMFGNCIMDNGKTINKWLTNDLKLSFHKFRILYNINLSIKTVYNTNTTMFVPVNKLSHNIYPARIEYIKNQFNNSFIQSLTDIIDETDVKLSMKFF
ncbi:MAG: hypothetical protein [Wendovervirus sonii]|uniref:Uncharacterized protein n=1 Tax=phage Lak_Megaphage_Sonny TaxID=3109229 RepID=A0ABZ0Z6I7_9CAUD|nr:MAG: hypothetical protein [phage Lak_Megaphage_Sonny]